MARGAPTRPPEAEEELRDAILKASGEDSEVISGAISALKRTPFFRSISGDAFTEDPCDFGLRKGGKSEASCHP